MCNTKKDDLTKLGLTPGELKVFEMYDEEGFGCMCPESHCEQCRENAYKDKKLNNKLEGPISLWFVGKDYPIVDDWQFDEDNPRVLFIGKEARFDEGDAETHSGLGLDTRKINGYFYDWTGDEAGRGVWQDLGSSFWEYTKAAITENVFRLTDKEQAREKIAMTNWVKCAIPDAAKPAGIKPSEAAASKNMKKECSFFIQEEIKVLKPTHVVIYGNVGDYAKYIEPILEALFDECIPVPVEKLSWKKVDEKSGQLRNISNPRNNQGYKCMKDSDMKMKVLISSHPENAEQKAFVKRICDFINNELF